MKLCFSCDLPNFVLRLIPCVLGPRIKGSSCRAKLVSCSMPRVQEGKANLQAHYKASANLMPVTFHQPVRARKCTLHSLRHDGCRLLEQTGEESRPIRQSTYSSISGFFMGEILEFLSGQFALSTFIRTQELKMGDNAENQLFNWGTFDRS